MNLKEATIEYLQARRRLGEESVWLDSPTIQVLRDLKDRPAKPKAVKEESLVAAKVSPPAEEPKALGPKLDSSEKAKELAALWERAKDCMKCSHLASSRTQVVFGVGSPDTDIMFVGEAPGADEDEQGEPFVGAAGQLLTKMIKAMGLERDEVYIANVLKCRPDMPAGSSGNRKPTAQEMATCLPYLTSQIEIIQPKVLVALGATAVEGLLRLPKTSIGKLRGKWNAFRGIPLMPTYHPAYLLRNQSNTEKRKVWEDLLLAMEKASLPISEKQRGYFLRKS